MSLRDAILGANDIQSEPVDVPEWNQKVIIRGLTGTERDAFEASLREFRPSLDGKGQELVLIQDNTRAKLLVKCIVDADGERVFTDRDASALGEKNGKVLDRLYDVAGRLSGLSDDDVQELAGNSDAGPTGDSPSSSPETSSTAP